MDLFLADLIPRELPAQTLDHSNMRIFRSKLWSQCTRAGLRIAVFDATIRVNFSITAFVSDFDNNFFLSVKFVEPGIEISTVPLQTTQSLIRALFGESVREIYIQEYCTDGISCDGRLTTTFGDKIKLIIDPAQGTA